MMGSANYYKNKRDDHFHAKYDSENRKVMQNLLDGRSSAACAKKLGHQSV
jgi:hypothetical protein